MAYMQTLFDNSPPYPAANVETPWPQAIPGASAPPKTYTGLKMGAQLKQGMAPGMPEHIEASAEVGLRAVSQGAVYDPALHDKHKATHGYSDVFSAAEIDDVDYAFRKAKKIRPSPGSNTNDAAPSQQGNGKSGKARKGQKT